MLDFIRLRAAGALFCGALSATACWSADAAAQDKGDSPEYTQAITEAVREFSAQRFEEARALFKRAHELSPNARTLRGMGLTAFELRMYVQVLRELEAALRDQHKPLTQEQRSQAQELIEKSKEFVGRVTLVLQPSEARLLVDGQVPEIEPGNELLLDVGVHVISATAPGYKPSNVRLRVEGGSTELVQMILEPIGAPEPAVPPIELGTESGQQPAAHDAPPEPTQPAPPAPADSGGGSLATLGWITLAGAAAFGGTAAAFWLAGDSGFADLDICKPNCTEQQIDDSGVETTDTLTNVFLGLAVASGVASGILFVLDGSSDDAQESVTLRVAPTAVAVGGRF